MSITACAVVLAAVTTFKGVTFIDKPIVLTPADSGRTFVGEPGAERMSRPEVQGVPCTLHFVNNIVLVREGPLCGEGVRNVGGVWANNLWYDVRGESKAIFDNLDWANWRDCGKETGGRFADPKFVDAEHFDFTLKPDSPAFEMGFKAWDYSQAGRK